MPRKDDDLDFKIFVDPSCLSDPMDGEAASMAEVPEIDIPADIPVDIPTAANESAEHELADSTLEQDHDDAPPTESVSTAQEDTATTEPVEDAEEGHTNELAEPELLADELPAETAESTVEPVHEDELGSDDTHDESIQGEADAHSEVLSNSEQLEAGEQSQSVAHTDRPENAEADGTENDDAETPKPVRVREDDFQPADRKTSLRTEALIQAAARAVVAKLEKRDNRGSMSQVDEAEHSLLSNGSGMYEIERQYDDFSRRESTESQIHHDISRPASGDEGGDSSSHHEADDDVFSDRSARSSLGSFDGPGDDTKPLSSHDSPRNSFGTVGRSPRVSGVSMISGLSQYDKDDFIPTSRETRLPFRTPSAVRAMQMASPTPSVFNGASPRSGKRQTPRNHLQSPTTSAQYSPKGRSTPTRLKSRKQAPLVLLHVTLLPLRWMWGDVLDGLDPLNSKALGEGQDTFQASEQLKTLRDTWRELQDCVGETVLERGILIPHPQDDFEVLEERLLEALELPLRRRARILECGHYLGPSNADAEDESDDDYASESEAERRHWCATCKGDIKYESLGPGKVFRLKVYASNGLMKAGAWEACWKDMERVDVEVEPIVEPAVQAELEKLVALQMEQEERRQQQAEAEAEAQAQAEAEAEAEAELRRREEAAEAELRRREEAAEGGESPDQTLPIQPDCELPDVDTSRFMASSPPPTSMQIMRASPPSFASPDTRMTCSTQPEPIDTSEERRRRDEERLREIYGEIPTPHPYSEMNSARVEPGSSRLRHPDSYIPPPTPRSPSEEAWERRQHRESQRRALDDASFIELMLEAFKVLLRDSKNVAIIVLCLFLICLMIRPAPQFPDNRIALYEPKQDAVMHAPVAKVDVHSETRVAVESIGVNAQAQIAAPIVSEVPDVARDQVDPPTSQLALGASETALVEPTSPSEPPAPEATVETAPEISESETLTPEALALETVKGIPEIEETEGHSVAEESPLSAVGADTKSTEAETEAVVVDPVPSAMGQTPADDEADLFEQQQLFELEPETQPLDLLRAEDVESPPVDEVPLDEVVSTSTVAATTTATATDADAESTEHPCESYAQSARSAAVSHVFPVTERKTIRVYETITETVRVSVTTTETASMVETAIPQTVEETVYETETVRITVSIPVDSAPEPSAVHDEL